MDIILELVSYNDQQAAITHIRHTVFTVEQGVDSAIDFDGLDPEAIQILCTINGKPAGTGRMLDDGHIGRIAVLPEYRSQGVGTQIMSRLMDTARARLFMRIYLYAQVNAVDFYRKLGFATCGENFEEAGILHTPMDMQFPVLIKQ